VASGWVPNHQLELRVPSPMSELDDQRLVGPGVRVWLKRDDLIHPELPGNKWRKLKFNVAAAGEQGHKTLLTFGGAYSNHIRAVAAAGSIFGFSTIGVIRGEEHLPLNSSLAFAVERGMRLAYLDRETYRRKHEPAVVDELRHEWGDFYLVPEGGSNALGVQGCIEIAAEIDLDFQTICCPVGTGGTLAGIAGGLLDGQSLSTTRSSSSSVPRSGRRLSVTGGSSTGSTSVDTPRPSPSSRPSSTTSPAVTASPWTGSTQPR
jgi:1-aminocyclopropane-1-carboxylate deaminase